VVHELVHALQDQHFGLGRTMSEARATDADNAFGALVEGDATLVMLAYGASLSGALSVSVLAEPEHVRRLMARPPAQLSGALRRAPALLREPLLFRYGEGAAFCAALFRHGGWAAVDAAHRAPPTSTRAVHEPARHLDHSTPPTLPVPDDAWLATRSLSRADDDVLGALELSVLLDLPQVRGSWRADRYLVLARPEGDASLWWVQLATPLAARVVAEAFTRLNDPARQIARHGALVLVGRALTRDQFASALAWTRHPVSASRERPLGGVIDLPAPRASTRQAPPLQPSRRARDAIAD
jgi:hypothetical protein